MGPKLERVEPPIINSIDVTQEPPLGEIDDMESVTRDPEESNPFATTSEPDRVSYTSIIKVTNKTQIKKMKIAIILKNIIH